MSGNSGLYSVEQLYSMIEVRKYLREFSNPAYFMSLCKECPAYSKRWCCPPYDFDPVEEVGRYGYAHLFAAKIVFTDKLKCLEHSESVSLSKQILDEVGRDVHNRMLLLREKNTPSLAFGVGCRLCGKNECARSLGKECLHPDKMLHSLESFGFDISKTCKELFNLELKWNANGSMPEYLTLVSALLSDSPVIL